MTSTIEEGLVVFDSTHNSIKADNLCEEHGVDASLIPTHPSISQGCGFMLKTTWNNFENLLNFLKEQGVPYKAIYYSKKIGIKRIVKEITEDDVKDFLKGGN